MEDIRYEIKSEKNITLFQYFILVDVLDFNDQDKNLWLGLISLEVYSPCENQQACRKSL